MYAMGTAASAPRTPAQADLRRTPDEPVGSSTHQLGHRGAHDEHETDEQQHRQGQRRHGSDALALYFGCCEPISLILLGDPTI